MFNKILIANRGEIAVRVIKSCKEMNIKTVAVYSDADKTAMHVWMADEAFYLGPSEPSASYLSMDKIIEAAKATQAQAIHPGYGFLSENAAFSKRCKEENIVFIGPPHEAIMALGNKIAARKLMKQANVPVIPGIDMIDPDVDFVVLEQQAQAIGYPILLKAAAGGGGKGMRIVEQPQQLKESFESASREAQKAFHDGTLYIERFFPKSRHIEVQVLADNQGNAIHLFERECSIQRRHQKIIEETPSCALNPKLREEICQAAVKAVLAAGYVNAGTVEFLLAPEDQFYFLEVNTRLQVEHPITEVTTGIDLVRQQIEIASGKPLAYHQSDIAPKGHAIECRIYAEDPENGFIPCPGKILFLKEPIGPGIRNDCGVYSGFEVPIHYDPILSKLVVFAEDRKSAIQRMVQALKQYAVLGVKTPIPFMIDILESNPFQQGETFTSFIADYFTPWQQSQKDQKIALMAYAIDQATKKIHVTQEKQKSKISPWDSLGKWSIG